MRKILLAVTFVLMLCGISSADFVYMTSSGSLGRISVNSSDDISSPSIEYTGTHESPFLASYWNGSDTRLVLIDRYAGVSGDRAYVFRPGSLTSYAKSADIDGVYGASGAGYSENGYSLFLTSGAEIYEVSTGDFSVLNSYDCTKIISDDDHATEIISMNVDTSLIHVIITAGDARKYAHFEGQLNDTKEYFHSADVSDGALPVLSTNNNNPIVGHSFGIDSTRSRNGRFYRVISTDHPVKAMCLDNTGSLFYSTQYQSGDKYINTITHLLEDTKFSPATIESSSPNIKLIRDDNRPEFFAAMTDEAIRLFIYQDGDTASWEYTASMLGGTPAGIVSATVSGYNANTSSSGCDASCLGLMMLAAVFMIRRK